MIGVHVVDVIFRRLGPWISWRGQDVDFQLGVSEQNLDDPDIDVLFEQMGGEAVALIPNSE
jgi:hypothetical protein